MECNNGKFWLGLGIGAALGVLTYYLSRTQKAKQLKENVLNALEDIEVMAMNQYDCAKQKVKATAAKVSGQVAEEINEVKGKFADPASK